MRQLVLIGLLLCSCSVETTTTTIDPLAEDVSDLTVEVAEREAQISHLTDANEELSATNEELSAEVDRLKDEIDQLEDYVGDLEEDLSVWVDWALALDASVSQLQAIPAPAGPTGPTAQWCAEYQLALESAAYARLSPGTDPLVIDGIQYAPGLPPQRMTGLVYLAQVVEPLESVGCPRPEGY